MKFTTDGATIRELPDSENTQAYLHKLSFSAAVRITPEAGEEYTLECGQKEPISHWKAKFTVVFELEDGFVEDQIVEAADVLEARDNFWKTRMGDSEPVKRIISVQAGA